LKRRLWEGALGAVPIVIVAVLVFLMIPGAWSLFQSGAVQTVIGKVERVETGRLITSDSLHMTLMRSKSIFPSDKVSTIDSSGNVKNTYGIPDTGSRPKETVRVETESGESAEILVSPPGRVWFPDVTGRPIMTRVLNTEGASVSVRHQAQPFLDWAIRPAVGLAYHERFAPQFGVTLIRLGPVYLGASVVVERKITPSINASVDVFPNLNISAGLTPRRSVIVGLRYHL